MIKHDVLESVGLTKAESIVYLSLLRLGRSRAGKIIKQSNLQSSVVHNSLNSLLEKGFISYVLIGSIREYGASDPLTIDQFIESKRKEFRSILPELRSMQKDIEFTHAEVYEGYSGLLMAMLSMISNCKKGELFKYFAAAPDIMTDELLAFFEKADKIRTSKGAVLKGIAQDKASRLKYYSASEIKFTKQHIPPAMNIFNDKILIMSLKEKPKAVLINSKELADQYHGLWDIIWKESEK